MRKIMKKASIVMLVMAMCITLLPVHSKVESAGINELDVMRFRLDNMLTGGTDYNADDPVIRAKIEALTSEALGYWNSMNKSSDRTLLWNDLDTHKDSDNPVSTHVSGAFSRLVAMALAYRTKGSSLQGDSELLADIEDGLRWMYAHRFNEDFPTRDQRYDNWFDWEIASPTSINTIGILLFDVLSQDALEIIENQVKIVLQDVVRGGATGANQLSFTNIVLMHGLITEDAELINNARLGIERELGYVIEGDGFYSDGSFIQHRDFGYNGTYGASFLENASRIIYVLADTACEVTGSKIHDLYELIINGFEPLIYNAEIMDMVKGRGISRGSNGNGHTEGHLAVGAIVRMSLFAPDYYASRYKSMVKHWVENDTYDDIESMLNSIFLIEELKNIMNDETVVPRGDLFLHKQYPNMDRAVHWSNGFAFGLSMFSNRMANYESINNENLKGWHSGDGMTYLYNTDMHAYEDFWPTVNSYRLPGTTVNQNSENESWVKSPHAWVGGTEISGLYGASGMQFASPGYTLGAKKSWFMFDDEIVALGADIASSDDMIVETIVENRKLNDAGDNPFTVNGVTQSDLLDREDRLTDVRWAHLEGNVPGSDIGYYFPTSPVLQTLREARTDNWRSIIHNGDLTYITRNYLNLWFDHGVNPTDDSYAYVLLPGKSADDVSQYAANPNIEILVNTGQVQAVREHDLGILAVNFWEDGVTTVGEVTSHTKSSVMVRQTNHEIEISVSDPTWSNNGTIELELDMEYGKIISLDPGVSLHQVDSKTKVSVNVRNARGKTFKAKFSLPGDESSALSTPGGLKATALGDRGVILNWEAVDRAEEEPAIPSGLTITGATEHSLLLQWEAAETATEYRIYRATSEEGPYYSVPDLVRGELRHLDDELAAGAQYFYKIVSVNEHGMSDYSEVVSAWTIPNPPANLTVTSDNNNVSEIALAWGEVAHIAEYRLYRSDAVNGPYSLVATLAAGQTSFIDTGVRRGDNYYYKITAVNSAGESAASSPIPTLFEVPLVLADHDFDSDAMGGHPAGLVIVENEENLVRIVETPHGQAVRLMGGGDKIVTSATSRFRETKGIVTVEMKVLPSIGWENIVVVDEADRAAVHVVINNQALLANDGGTRKELASVAYNGSWYQLKMIINTETNTFDLYVDDVRVAEQFSFRTATNSVSGITFSIDSPSFMHFDDVRALAIPFTPQPFAVSERTDTSITLSWGGVADAEGYRLYRSELPDGEFELIQEIESGLSYTDENLETDQMYFYKIAAVSLGATSAESPVISAVTGFELPDAPTNLKVSQAAGAAVELTWQQGALAQEYVIYKSTEWNGTYEEAGTTDNLIFIDEGNDPDIEYFYKVFSINSRGMSEASNIVSSLLGLSMTLVDDHFNDDSIGGHPDGWTIEGAEPDNVKVVASENGNAVGLTGVPNPGMRATRQFGEMQGIVTVEVAVLPTLNWKNIPLIVDKTGKSGVHVYFNGAAGGGSITAYTSSSERHDVYPIRYDGTWYQVKVVLNTNTRKYDLYVDGNKVASQFGFRENVDEVSAIRVAVDNNTYVEFDDVKVAYMPFAPAELSAYEATSSSISLSWNAAQGVTDYRLYRSTAPDGGFAFVDQISGTAYTDTALDSDATYYYKVAAIRGTAVSEASQVVSGTTEGDALDDQTDNIALQYPDEKTTGREIRILSAGDQRDVSYILFRDGEEIARTAETTYEDHGLEAGRTYSYYIVAYDGLGNRSEASEAVPFTVKQTAVPSNPSGPGGLPTPEKTLVMSAADLQNGEGGIVNVTLSEGYTELLLPEDADILLDGSLLLVHSGEVQLVIPSDALRLPSERVGSGRLVIQVGESGSGEAVVAFVIRDGLNDEPVAALAAPLQLALNIDRSKVNTDLLGIYHYNDESGAWDYIFSHYDEELQAISGMISTSGTYAAVEFDKTFIDVPEQHWSHAALKILASKHIVKGETEQRFNPNAGTSRAEFITMLVRSLNLSVVDVQTPSFTDVAASDWHSAYIETAFASGLVNGTGLQFAPDADITREQMAALLVRAFELTGAEIAADRGLSQYRDEDEVSSWATTDVEKAIAAGLMQGSHQHFRPQDNATRAETAQAIYNLFKKLYQD